MIRLEMIVGDTRSHMDRRKLDMKNYGTDHQMHNTVLIDTLNSAMRM